MVIASFIVSLVALIVGGLALYLHRKEFRTKIPAITKASWKNNPDGKKIFSITVVSPDIVPIKNLLIKDNENDNTIPCDYVINNDKNQSFLINGGNNIEISPHIEELSDNLKFIVETPFGKSQKYYNEIISGSFAITPLPAIAKAEAIIGTVVIHDYAVLTDSVKVKVEKPKKDK